MRRALELDEGFGRGTIHDFYIAWEGRGESVGGSFQQARAPRPGQPGRRPPGVSW
jgi:hypothetical protein